MPIKTELAPVFYKIEQANIWITDLIRECLPMTEAQAYAVKDKLVSVFLIKRDLHAMQYKLMHGDAMNADVLARALAAVEAES